MNACAHLWEAVKLANVDLGGHVPHQLLWVQGVSGL